MLVSLRNSIILTVLLPHETKTYTERKGWKYRHTFGFLLCMLTDICHLFMSFVMYGLHLDPNTCNMNSSVQDLDPII